jgi:hypothetical protein
MKRNQLKFFPQDLCSKFLIQIILSNLFFRWIFSDRKNAVNRYELNAFTHTTKLQFPSFLEALIAIDHGDNAKFMKKFTIINSSIRKAASNSPSTIIQGEKSVGFDSKVLVLLELLRITSAM